jgi:acetyl-CoA carboxylase biotin carboxyl carrier protein
MSEQAAMQSTKEERPQEGGGAKQQERGSSSSAGQHERGGTVGGRGRGRRHQQPNQPRRPEPSLNMEELRDLVKLIAEHGFTDFELEREGFRVRLRRELAPQMLAAQTNLAPQTLAPTDSAAQSVAASGSQAPSAATAQTGASIPSPPHPGEQAEAAAAEDADLHIITSPIVGTFYRYPSPTAEPFVRLGSQVHPDVVVCIIEAMKLMNEIQAETTGVVEKIYVENGQPVEYGQPLFGIKKQ